MDKEPFLERLVSTKPLFYPGESTRRFLYEALCNCLPYTSWIVPYDEIKGDKVEFTVDKEYFSPNGYTHGVLTHSLEFNLGTVILSCPEEIGLSDKEIKEAIEKYRAEHPEVEEYDNEELIGAEIDEAMFLPDNAVDDAIFESVYENLKEAIEKFYSWDCN